MHVAPLQVFNNAGLKSLEIAAFTICLLGVEIDLRCEGCTGRETGVPECVANNDSPY
jgi:hypothetical protein